MPVAGVEEQLTMRELMLNDALFTAWMKKVPNIEGRTISARPWRVWVKPTLKARWAKRDFKTYAKAYKFLVKQVKAGVHDAALSSRAIPFKPPVVRKNGKKQYHVPAMVGQNSAHKWCPYCRRPTIFSYFTKHHAFTGRSVGPNGRERRCAICGHGENHLPKYTGVH